jgi:hypothetical protein
MLPMTLQFLIVMITITINDRLQHKLDYTMEEVRAWSAATRGLAVS